MTYHIEDHSSSLDRSILDSVKSISSVKSVRLKITATHSGKMNGNYVLYTPRSMAKGVNTLLEPFPKHLQAGHNGKAVGVINDAKYVNLTAKYPELEGIANKIDNAKTNKELVSAVKELVKHPVYSKPDFDGLGTTEVYATLYHQPSIYDLKTGQNAGKVSIGGDSDSILCSICANKMTRNHTHKRGNFYKDELCFAIYDSMLLDHVGFVPNPADTKSDTTILDSNLKHDSSVTIENYNIQDSLEGNLNNMKINYEQFKKLASNPQDVAKVFGVSEEATANIVSLLQAETAPALKSAYLLSEEKLLPVYSKLNIAAAKLLVSQLEDDVPEKQVLQDLVNHQVGIHFDGESLDEYVESLKTVEAAASKVPDAANTGVPVSQSLEIPQEVLEQIATSVASKLSATLEATQTAIQDSQRQDQYHILVARNKDLEQDVSIIQDSLNALTLEYHEAIMNQILSKKDLTKESKYYTEVLSTKSVDQLKAILEDLSYASTDEGKQAALPKEEPLDKAKIQDSLKNAPDAAQDPEKGAQPADEGGEGKIQDSEEDIFIRDVTAFGIAKALQLKQERKK